MFSFPTISYINNFHNIHSILLIFKRPISRVVGCRSTLAVVCDHKKRINQPRQLDICSSETFLPLTHEILSLKNAATSVGRNTCQQYEHGLIILFFKKEYIDFYFGFYVTCSHHCDIIAEFFSRFEYSSHWHGTDFCVQRIDFVIPCSHQNRGNDSFRSLYPSFSSASK